MTKGSAATRAVKIEPTCLEAAEEALRETIPNVEVGRFSLTPAVLERMPSTLRAALRGFAGWRVVVFAIPITDEGLWLWHYDGRHRRLFANLVLAEAALLAVRRVRDRGGRAEQVCALVGQSFSMTEAAVVAGLGTRGWNNLLLHPRWGAWLQIDALLVDAGQEAETSTALADVCIHCGHCLRACPARALEVEAFHPAACARLVAAPWMARSRARAISESSYLECSECLRACPIGTVPSPFQP